MFEQMETSLTISASENCSTRSFEPFELPIPGKHHGAEHLRNKLQVPGPASPGEPEGNSLVREELASREPLLQRHRAPLTTQRHGGARSMPRGSQQPNI